ncbi:hypothetical protein ACP8H2_09615 [Bacillus subtilis]|uniref:hypothetical protein n=1 Tax=Bacillus subtilis TaxID=1423 RepID=UPI003CF50098
MAEQEKQTLQKGKSYVTVVGKAKVNDKTYGIDLEAKSSDYRYSRLNLGIETAEGNVVYGEMMGGFSPSNDYPIKARTKPVDGKSENVDISWADRLNESIIDTLSQYSTINIGLELEGEYNGEGKDERKYIVKRFLSAYDAVVYIKEHLKDGMMIMAKGSHSFQKHNGEDKKRFNIESIFLSKQESGFANFVQTILIDEDSVTKSALKDAKESGYVAISARAVDYVGKIDGKPVKKNMTFEFPFVVKVNEENPELTEGIISKLFKVKKGKIREITIEGQILEGYEQSQVSEKDIKISKDVQELIAMGLYSKEEAMQKMTVRGNKISKMIFTRPFILKDKDDATKLQIDMNDSKYTPEDLYVEIEEDNKDDGQIDLSGATEELSNDTGDNSWLSSLGLDS